MWIMKFAANTQFAAAPQGFQIRCQQCEEREVAGDVLPGILVLCVTSVYRVIRVMSECE